MNWSAFTVQLSLNILIVSAQAYVCWLSFLRWKGQKSDYHFKILSLHPVILLGVVLGLVIDLTVFLRLPDAFMTLKLDRFDNYPDVFVQYRIMYYIQLMSYQAALLGLLLLGLERLKQVVNLTKLRSMDMMWVKAFFWIYFIWLEINITYMQFFPATWTQWQTEQTYNIFHIFHGLWFFIVCSVELLAAWLNIQVVLNWNTYTDRPLRLRRQSRPMLLPQWVKPVMLMDAIAVVAALIVHFYAYLNVTNATDRTLAFRFCYLSVSTHFMASYFYLDAVRLLAKDLTTHKKLPLARDEPRVTPITNLSLAPLKDRYSPLPDSAGSSTLQGTPQVDSAVSPTAFVRTTGRMFESIEYNPPPNTAIELSVMGQMKRRPSSSGVNLYL
ncbi:hypothetical protein EDD86DRAFT_201283, partial [Gorgonomyces haynaldii]